MPLVIDPVTGEKRYKYPDSTTSQGGGGRETIELQRLLSRAGVEAPEPKPISRIFLGFFKEQIHFRNNAVSYLTAGIK